jgi:hypothetical protein
MFQDAEPHERQVPPLAPVHMRENDRIMGDGQHGSLLGGGRYFPQGQQYDAGSQLPPAIDDMFLDDGMRAGIEALMLEEEASEEYTVGQVKRMQVRGKPGVVAKELTC